MNEGDHKGESAWDPQIIIHYSLEERISQLTSIQGTTHFLEMSMDMAWPPLINILFLNECVQISLVTMNWLCLCILKFPSGPQKAVTARRKGAGSKQCTWTQRMPSASSPCLYFSPRPLIQRSPADSGEACPLPNPGCPMPICPGHSDHHQPNPAGVSLRTFARN